MLERSCRVVNGSTSNWPVTANLYLFDAAAVAELTPWLQAQRQTLSPDSPPVILIQQERDESSPIETSSLVDAQLSAQLSGEQLREELLHWLHLQASAKLWQAASSSTTPPQAVPVPSQGESGSTPPLSLPPLPQRELLAMLFDSLSQGLFLCDRQGMLLAVNEPFCQLMGYRSEELIGQTAEMLLPRSAQGELAADFRRRVYEQGRWEGELSACRKEGAIFPLWLQVRYLPAEEERTERAQGYFLGLTTDLRASRQLEECVLQLSRTDSLSELNRILLEERLALDIRQAELTHTKVALIRVHLSRFRALNEQYGRAIGDWVLMTQMQRLQSLVGAEGLVSRLAASEYAIILPRLAAIEPALALAEEIVAQLSVPLQYDKREILSLPQLGLSDYPELGSNASELLQQAELALDWCRQQTPLALQRFNLALSAKLRKQHETEQALRNALLNNEFFLVYQPQLDMKHHCIVGVEALIRWRQPDRIVPPAEFIPLAEKSGLIVPISNWVLKTACQQAAEWVQQGLDLHMAVNLSALHFQHVLLVEQVEQWLRESGLPPERLELEVTESCIMTDVESAIAKLQALKELGVTLSVDDFGTGYSSLSYLKLFPLNKLKIDQSFIRDFLLSNSDAVIVRAIIALGHAMGLTVIAEGVETLEQYRYLRTLHCNELQGFFFARPQLPEFIPELLRKDFTGELGLSPADGITEVPVLLLVDDEALILSALKRTLRSNSYRIITAHTAAQALNELAHHKVGVIISDSRLPDAAGIELLRQVKERYPHITRIMLSGYADMTALSAAINGGEIFRFIGKPWDDGEIQEAVQAGLQKFDEQCHQGNVLF
ncbi:MAG: EAL domain-containing protein [Aeromonadaceae bacterium]